MPSEKWLAVIKACSKIREINAKTDLPIQLEWLERSLHGRVAALIFAIKTQAVANDDVLLDAKP